MARGMWALLLAALLAFGAAGCGTGEAPTTDPDDPADAPGVPDEGPLADAAALAVEDAAGQAGVDAGEVEVVLAEEVTWPDGALGCPESDMMYTQALVEGYRVVVEVEGDTVHYHGAEGDEPFRCDDPQEPADASAAPRE